MADSRNSEADRANPITLEYLHQTLRNALLWAGLACIVGSALSPWYLCFYSREVEAFTLLGMLEASKQFEGVSSYAVAGALMAAALWLSAAMRVGANSEQADSGMAALTALTALILFACHSSVSNTIGYAEAGPGLPLMLLSVAFSRTCAVKLRRR